MYGFGEDRAGILKIELVAFQKLSTLTEISESQKFLKFKSEIPLQLKENKTSKLCLNLSKKKTRRNYRG